MLFMFAKPRQAAPQVAQLKITQREKTVYSTIHKTADKSAHRPHRRDVSHISCKVLKLFFIEILSFPYVTETIGFSPYKSLYFECYVTKPMLACEDSYFSEGEKRRPGRFAGYAYVRRCLPSMLGYLWWHRFTGSQFAGSSFGRDHEN